MTPEEVGVMMTKQWECYPPGVRLAMAQQLAIETIYGRSEADSILEAAGGNWAIATMAVKMAEVMGQDRVVAMARTHAYQVWNHHDMVTVEEAVYLGSDRCMECLHLQSLHVQDDDTEFCLVCDNAAVKDPRCKQP
jgi:hypothetical protein